MLFLSTLLISMFITMALIPILRTVSLRLHAGLGRILRLPRASKKRREALNCAYAFAASQNFVKTAQSLQDALVEGAGFQRLEAKDLIVPEDNTQRQLWEGSGITIEESEKVYEEPDLSQVGGALRFAVLWRKRSNGTQSEKGNRWVERLLSFRQTCRLRNQPTFPLLADAVKVYFKE